MRAIKEILYGTEEYAKTLALRNKVMRIPLGLNIQEEDCSSEQDALMVEMFESENLLGVGVMSNHGPDYKLEQLCIDSEIQSCGIGASLLEHLEERAKEQGAEKISMDARVSAKKFYARHGYETVGDIFLLDYAPVEHIVMEKKLTM